MWQCGWLSCACSWCGRAGREVATRCHSRGVCVFCVQAVGECTDEAVGIPHNHVPREGTLRGHVQGCPAVSASSPSSALCLLSPSCLLGVGRAAVSKQDQGPVLAGFMSLAGAGGESRRTSDQRDTWTSLLGLTELAARHLSFEALYPLCPRWEGISTAPTYSFTVWIKRV